MSSISQQTLYVGSEVPSLRGWVDNKGLPLFGNMKRRGVQEPSRTCDKTGKGGNKRGKVSGVWDVM